MDKDIGQSIFIKIPFFVCQVRHWFPCSWVTMTTGITCLMDRKVGNSTGKPAPWRAWRMKLSILTELKTISVSEPLPDTQGETGHPGRRSTHLSKGPWWAFVSRCIVTYTTQRAEINKPITCQSMQQILESVFLGLSLPLITPLSAKNVPLVQQKLEIFCKQFHEMVSQKSIRPNLNETVIVAPDGRP